MNVVDLVRSFPGRCDECGRGLYAPRISGSTYGGTIEVTCDCSNVIASIDVDGTVYDPDKPDFQKFDELLHDIKESFVNVMTDEELVELEHRVNYVQHTVREWSGKPILIGKPGFFGCVAPRSKDTLEEYLREGYAVDVWEEDEDELHVTLLK